MAKEYIRRAHHAGSWYEDDSQTLDRIIKSYLNEALSPVSQEEMDATAANTTNTTTDTIKVTN